MTSVSTNAIKAFFFNELKRLKLNLTKSKIYEPFFW